MRDVLKGSVDQSEYFSIVENTAGTAPGEPKTGLTHSDITSAYYTRTRAAAVQITGLSTLAAATTAHTDGGFKEVDATNQPGIYRFDPPDACYASGADEVVIQLNMSGASNSIAKPIKNRLVAFNPQDAQRLGLTALPAVNAGGVGGIGVLDSNSQLPANLLGINSSTALLALYAKLVSLSIVGIVDDTDLAPSATTFQATGISEATADHYRYRTIVFLDGNMALQATKILSYSLVSGKGQFTVIEMTEPPVDGVQFMIV